MHSFKYSQFLNYETLSITINSFHFKPQFSHVCMQNHKSIPTKLNYFRFSRKINHSQYAQSKAPLIIYTCNHVISNLLIFHCCVYERGGLEVENCLFADENEIKKKISSPLMSNVCLPI